MLRKISAITILCSIAVLSIPAIAYARHHHHRSPSPSTGDLTPTLRSKVTEIMRDCHSDLISGYRPGARVLGSGHPSLHSVFPSRAADLRGNPSCIYTHLRDWPGGYSTDYWRPGIRHVHISYSPPGYGYLAGREWHARFVHWGAGARYAHYRHRRHMFVARG